MLLYYAVDEVYKINHSFTDKEKGIGRRKLINGMEVPAEY